MKRLPQFCVWTALIVMAVPCYAQWTTQSFTLQPGWNSIYLEVDPSPANPDELFAGLPVEAVWTRTNDLLVKSSADCLDCAPPDESEWYTWIQPSQDGAIATTLRLLRGGRVYLVKASEATTLNLVGKPSGTRTRWRKGFNLAGFHVVNDPGAAPTFQGYLAGSKAHASTWVFDLQANGTWTKITNPGSTRISPGRGYWVSASEDVEYDGPIEVDQPSLRGLDFGRSLTDHSISLRNITATARTVTLKAIASAPVPALPAGLPSLAGSLPVAWLDYGAGAQVTDVYQWRSLNSRAWPLAATGSAGDRAAIRLAANRANLTEAVLNSAGQGSQYQSILTVEDGAGFRRVLPAVAQVPSRSGLWVGYVTVNAVAWVTAPLSGGGDSTATRPTSSEFTFPIIIHKSASACKMLTEVTMMWRPGNTQTGTPGRYVLVTPDAAPSLVAQLQAGSLKDGQPFSRRISTAAFAFDDDLPLSGALGGSLTGLTTIPANHRLNPFYHKYHPDHDGNQAGETYEIERAFTLAFEQLPPAGTVTAGWGNSYLAGTYAETIKGLYKVSETSKVPVNVAGRFELRRVSEVPTLNDQ